MIREVIPKADRLLVPEQSDPGHIESYRLGRESLPRLALFADPLFVVAKFLILSLRIPAAFGPLLTALHPALFRHALPVRIARFGKSVFGCGGLFARRRLRRLNRGSWIRRRIGRDSLSRWRRCRRLRLRLRGIRSLGNHLACVYVRHRFRRRIVRGNRLRHAQLELAHLGFGFMRADDIRYQKPSAKA